MKRTIAQSPCLQKSYTDNTGKRNRVKKGTALAIEKCLAKVSPSLDTYEDVVIVATGCTSVIIDLQATKNEVSKTLLLDEYGIEVPVTSIKPAEPNQLNIVLSGALLTGYYELYLFDINSNRKASAPRYRIICAPDRAHQLSVSKLASVLAVQLYSLRSKHNWGIGDFGDLKILATKAHQSGYRFIALNPLHLIHTGEAGEISPYSPLSRLLLNWLYINVPAVPYYSKDIGAIIKDWSASSGFEAEIDRLRQIEYVDYDGVIGVKYRILRELSRLFWQRFELNNLEPALHQEFVTFLKHYKELINQQTENADIDSKISRFNLYVQWICQVQLAECFPEDGASSQSLIWRSGSNEILVKCGHIPVAMYPKCLLVHHRMRSMPMGSAGTLCHSTRQHCAWKDTTI